MRVGEGPRNILALDQVGTCCWEVVDWGMLLCGLESRGKEGCPCMVTLEERSDGGKKVSLLTHGEVAFQAEGTANAKLLRFKRSWCIQGAGMQ